MTDFERGVAKWTSDKYNQTRLNIDGIANNHVFFSYGENEVMLIGIAVPITTESVFINNTTIKDLLKAGGSIQIAKG